MTRLLLSSLPFVAAFGLEDALLDFLLNGLSHPPFKSDPLALEVNGDYVNPNAPPDPQAVESLRTELTAVDQAVDLGHAKIHEHAKVDNVRDLSSDVLERRGEVGQPLVVTVFGW